MTKKSLSELREEMRSVAGGERRPPSLPTKNERIVIGSKIAHGKPVIRGTRVPVAVVVDSVAAGMSFEEVQREYGLTEDDIRAALKFAGETS